MTQDTQEIASESLVGQLLLDKLRVDSVLGRGGMGVVYRVTHMRTHHQRALKVLHPHIRLHPDALARFLREATVSGTLKSPHVVETLDSGQLPDGSFYVLMELLEGKPLNELIEEAPLKLPRIARLLGQVCSALSLAHAQGIVHRDIKPDNLFVTRDAQGNESVKILDFGIARFRQKADVMGELTGENAILGTPLYMAPEQIGNANAADGRADIYALGVVLYEALSGRKPYSADSFAELVAHIFDGKQTPLERTAPGLTPRAYEVVNRAMARKAEDRFQSAAELGQALRELEQPFIPPTIRAVAPDALAATAYSTRAKAGAGPIVTPHRLPAPVPETESRVVPPTRPSSALPWIALGLSGAALAVVAFSVLGGPDEVVGPVPGRLAAQDAGPEMVAATGDAGTDAPTFDTGSDAGQDAGVDGGRRGGRRRDAGRLSTLAGPEEFGGGP